MQKGKVHGKRSVSTFKQFYSEVSIINHVNLSYQEKIVILNCLVKFNNNHLQTCLTADTFSNCELPVSLQILITFTVEPR